MSAARIDLRPEDWGFATDATGALTVAGISAEALAREHGTPLHVVDLEGLRARARRFRSAFERRYPAPVSVHFALKCNSTPGIVAAILAEGIAPEVSTPYEWALARRLGSPPGDAIVNGPLKGALLAVAAAEGARFVVADGLQDLEDIAEAAERAGRGVPVLLRVNPNCVPRGMNRATATGSRAGSVFGLDLERGEVREAMRRIASSPRLLYAGLHCHVGTGIRRPSDYARPVARLIDCAADALRMGLPTGVLDLGGGFGVSTSRELATGEFLAYQAFGRPPKGPDAARFPSIETFADSIAEAVVGACAKRGLTPPPLVLEPGRSLASQAAALLLTVGSIKRRAGLAPWAITDGGTGTVAFPLHYEYHEILLCRAPRARRSTRYTIVGPACFAADWVSRNKTMPPLVRGDVLAVCDSGAYFTVQESNFGYPRPAVVAVKGGRSRVMRRRESFDDMVRCDADGESLHGD